MINRERLASEDGINGKFGVKRLRTSNRFKTGKLLQIIIIIIIIIIITTNNTKRNARLKLFAAVGLMNQLCCDRDPRHWEIG